jgi:oligoendopeptidase F
MPNTIEAHSAEATGVTWDLSDLFEGVDDPKIVESLDFAKRDAEAFAGEFRGKINVPDGPSPAVLLAGLRAFEDLHERIGRVICMIDIPQRP